MGDGSNMEIAFHGVLEADAKLLLKFKRIIDEHNTRQLDKIKDLKTCHNPDPAGRCRLSACCSEALFQV